MGGSIQILGDVPSLLMPQVRAGKIKALGMFSAKRVAGAAEVPTIAEAGGPLIESSTWVLFLAPAGTPREIVNRISAETAKAVASADIKGRFETLGVEPVGNTAGEAGKFLDDEIAKWAKVISTAGVKPDQKAPACIGEPTARKKSTSVLECGGDDRQARGTQFRRLPRAA